MGASPDEIILGALAGLLVLAVSVFAIGCAIHLTRYAMEEWGRSFTRKLNASMYASLACIVWIVGLTGHLIGWGFLMKWLGVL